MITLDKLIDDLELRFTSAKPSQDFEVPKAQMAEWIDNARDRVMREYIDGNKFDIDDSIVMNIYATGITNNVGRSRLEYTLPVMPLDLNKSRGVLFVGDSNGNQYSRVSRSFVKEISKMTFTKPSQCNYQYVVEGDKLILFGPDPLSIGSLSMDIALVPAETHRIKEYDEKYYVMPSAVNDILSIAEQVGLREINQGVYDLTNDGVSNNDN
jgi:hypothetical protein